MPTAYATAWFPRKRLLVPQLHIHCLLSLWSMKYLFCLVWQSYLGLSTLMFQACPGTRIYISTLWKHHLLKSRFVWFLFKLTEWDLQISESLSTHCKNTSDDKLRKYGLDEWSVKWIENWLNGRTQSVVISDAESSWRLVTSGVPQGSVWAQSCLTSSSTTWMKS